MDMRGILNEEDFVRYYSSSYSWFYILKKGGILLRGGYLYEEDTARIVTRNCKDISKILSVNKV